MRLSEHSRAGAPSLQVGRQEGGMSLSLTLRYCYVRS
jgi:hypothetical protein